MTGSMHIAQPKHGIDRIEGDHGNHFACEPRDVRELTVLNLSACPLPDPSASCLWYRLFMAGFAFPGNL
jgi:hypothetical protein